MAAGMHALALHVRAEPPIADGVARGPRAAAAEDAVQRAARICRYAGIAEQRTLAGRQATCAAVRAALREAVTTMMRDGLLVLTFAGRAVRDAGPSPSTRWRLFDGDVEIRQLAAQVTRLPPTARLIVVVEACHAAAIGRYLRGPQLTVVFASCGADQTMRERPHSELAARLERLVCDDEPAPSLVEVRRALEAGTPDIERPWVWTNVADWWRASVRAIFANTA